MTQYRVFVVEDNAGDAEVIRRAVEEAGATACVFSTADDARAALAGARPDLFLVDALLPDTTGALFLRDDLGGRLAPVPTVVVTGVEGRAIHETFYSYPHVRAVLVKTPWLGDDVRAAVDFWRRVPPRSGV